MKKTLTYFKGTLKIAVSCDMKRISRRVNFVVKKVELIFIYFIEKGLEIDFFFLRQSSFF